MVGKPKRVNILVSAFKRERERGELFRALRYKSGTDARLVLHRAFPCNPG